ncbi:prostacyclin synthase-like [Anguilla rostrata]|uniref:Prostacyclin synthase n=2 Tax=Anguilla anguilla TaxID=7936 RepID=A0A9D3LRI9_ANGAN|nr:prostacyclin synthase-like [Anguilla anguilla]KAG5835757.1 hypothetical protein ANANG_G00247400 [Anguilla anguilla]
MFWTTLLLLHCVLVLFLILSNRSRSKKEPPLDKGIIPWLGHALEFGRDASKFLTRMKLKHGDIFTVRVAGHYVTVLLDPDSYDAVLQDSVTLDFTRYAQVLMQRIFSLSLPNHNNSTEKALMMRHFQGDSLTCLNSVMEGNLQALLQSETIQDQKNWKQDGLFNFCYSLLFRAGYLTLFGAEQSNHYTDSSAVYKEFRKFDSLLTKMARNMLNPEEKRIAGSVRQQLWSLLSAALPGEKTEDTWLQNYLQHLKDEAVDEEMQKRAMLLQLWATQGNVGPAAFWLLGFLLINPEAMNAVKKEFDSLLLQADSPQGLPFDKLQNTPVFDSVLNETLRLTAAPFITREVLHSKTLCMADGREYDIRKGDRMCLFPYISPQMDPEIHEEPEKFKYDRFLNSNGSEKREFYKGGRRLKYYTMPWGAGKNKCVGQQFAISSIKQLLLMVLTRLDLELCDPASTMPKGNPSRYGFGVLQPEGDMEIRYKLRCTL